LLRTVFTVGKMMAGQNADDRDDRQQFDQGEAGRGGKMAGSMVSWLRGKIRASQFRSRRPERRES